MSMHGLDAKCYLLETPLAEIFRKVPSFLEDYFGELSALTKLQEYPETLLELVDFLAPHQLVTVQVLYQAALIDYILALGT